jgi:dTDP-4-amino-4,6-dideoxygalactose transaminase
MKFQEKIESGFSYWLVYFRQWSKGIETSFAKYCGTHIALVQEMVWMLWFWFLKHTFSGNYKRDEVIVPANTYIASILAILEADLIPVLVEPKLETYNINPDLITEKSTQNQSRSCGSSLRTIGRNGCDTWNCSGK